MEQVEPPSPLTPAQGVARRVREVRAHRGWSAAQLAQRCAQVGAPQIDRSAIAKIESGRRQRITVDELLALSLALGVAPVHLLVPLDEGWFLVTPEHVSAGSRVRQWIRGRHFIAGSGIRDEPGAAMADRDSYWREQPRQEWEPPAEQTPEQLRAQRQQVTEEMLAEVDAGRMTVRTEASGVLVFEPVDEPEA